MLARIISGVVLFFRPHNDERKQLLKKEKPTFETLPSDVKNVILSFVSPFDLPALTEVNKDLKERIEKKNTVYDVKIDAIEFNGTFKEIRKQLKYLNNQIIKKNNQHETLKQLKSAHFQSELKSKGSCCVAGTTGCMGATAIPGCVTTAILLEPHIGPAYAFLGGVTACISAVCIGGSCMTIFSQVRGEEERKIFAIEREIKKQSMPITFTMHK